MPKQNNLKDDLCQELRPQLLRVIEELSAIQQATQQDCIRVRSRLISLCAILDKAEVEGKI